MKKIQYIVLQEENGTFSIDVFNSNLLAPTDRNNIAKIKEVINSFHIQELPSIMRLHIKAEKIAEDKLFLFVRANLSNNINITAVPHIKTDYVYKIANDKIIVLMRESRWKYILERYDQVHTAHHSNADILQSIYNLSKQLYVSFISTMPAKYLLPAGSLQKFIQLHSHNQNILPTIQWCDEERRIYKIKDYPRSVLLKICPQMSLRLADQWKNKAVSLFSVLYFACNKCAYEILPDENHSSKEIAATLDWEKGTFITNKECNKSHYKLIAEVHESHLTTRWGFPGCYSVVGASGKVYYGKHHWKKTNNDSLSKNFSTFIEKILTSSTWYDESLRQACIKTTFKDHYNFTYMLYEKLFPHPLFNLSQHAEFGDNIDIQNLPNKLCDLACVHENKLCVCYGIQSRSDDSIQVEMLPIESFIEFFLPALHEGQEALVTGFIYNVAKLLFTHNMHVDLKEEL